jgi:hypothetical protein
MKLTRMEILRRIRLGNLRTLFRDRWGAVLPDDDAGRGDLLEMLICISLGDNASLKMAHAIEVWAPWMPRAEGAELLDHVSRMPSQDRKVSGKSLGQRLRVTNGERERLGLWTIAPCDMTEEQMAEQRRAKKKARDARRYKRGRGDFMALDKLQPWKAEGISRATYYRRRETKQRQQLEGLRFTPFTPSPPVHPPNKPLRLFHPPPFLKALADSQPLPRLRQKLRHS